MKIEHDVLNISNFHVIGISSCDLDDGCIRNELRFKHKAHDPRDTTQFVLNESEVTEITQYWENCVRKAFEMFNYGGEQK